MEKFLQQHAGSVMGVLSGWDRLRFRGTLRMLANVTGMSRFLSYTGHLFKDFGRYAQDVSRLVRASSLAAAELAGRPVEHLDNPSVSKEDRARQIARQDGISEGLIAVLTAVEGCWSYDIRSNRQTGHLELVRAYRKCQHLYHYQIHPVFGFMHVRLQTWLPFNVNICMNGREWLARQMDRRRIDYRQADNCFTWIGDLGKAQSLADQQTSFDWATVLAKLAAAANPARKTIIGSYNIPYYWSLDQSEWASDVMFKRAKDLDALYPSLIRHGMQSLGSREVMRFLGRSVSAGITPRFAGEVVSDIREKPEKYEGMRIKHRVNRNSVKMYNKAGSVLRVETTLNDMRDLQAPRIIEGRKVYKRMRKGVADIPRRAQVSQGSNSRYLEAQAAVNTPVALKTLTEKLSERVKWKGKAVRGLNLLGAADAALLAEVGRGEHLISGFRNRDLQERLFTTPASDALEQRRRSGQITRKLRMLRAHGLIAKLPNTHRYRISNKGQQVVAALHAAREANIQTLTQAA
jgi:hypothetical protein